MLVLAWLWTGVRWLMDAALYADRSDSDPLLYSLEQMINGQALPLHQAWAGIFAELVYATLGLAVFDHFVIGTLRLLGFNVLRNTYKPLLAQSIVDFWNRFYYYFKELLVDFFFYPTFLSYFKKSPQLRMFTAVMAAAFIGNFYYHTLMWLAWGEVSLWGSHGLTTRIEPYLLYSFLLDLGVYISMLREQARRSSKRVFEESLQRLFKTKFMQFDGSAIMVKFEETVTQEQFENVIKNLLFIARSVDKNTLFEQHLNNLYDQNPQQALETHGDVMPIAPGCYGLQGNFLKVCKSFQDQVMGLAHKHNAIEQEFPVLWPVEMFKSINYFSDYPHQVMLTATPQENRATRLEFADKYKKTNDFERIDLNENMEPAPYGLAPMVCGCCYYTLRNRQSVENKIYTTYNKVFRNERSNINSLDRLITFSVRDIVFVGDSEFVLHTRQLLIDDLIVLLQQWGIDCKVETANDPFFSNESMYKNVYQYKHRTKYELLARLSFGDRHIAIGSINLHEDYYSKNFDIQEANGSHVHSGCIGIGFERLTYALYCQYYPNEEEWPEEIAAMHGVLLG